MQGTFKSLFLAWFENNCQRKHQKLQILLIFAAFKNRYVMSVTRLKRKNRKDKAKAARRRTDLKNQNFKPVMKAVDVDKIKEEFKAKKK